MKTTRRALSGFKGLLLVYMGLLGLAVLSCVKSRDFDAPEQDCPQAPDHLISYQELKAYFKGETVQIQDRVYISGYVTSSDAAGNFYSVLHLQNRSKDPSDGIQLAIDQRDTYLQYPIGSHVYIDLKGLYLGHSKVGYSLGASYTSFGNLSVGRLPALAVQQHLLRACEAPSALEPRTLTIAALDTAHVNTLVALQGVQLVPEEAGQPFAVAEEETLRTLQDCEGIELTLTNSGYADFFDEPMPAGNGIVTGVVLRDKDKLSIAIRTIEDLGMAGDRCAPNTAGVGSDSLFISEIADPVNNSKARFVELYNSGQVSLSLKGWSLQRYTNDNTEPGAGIALTGHTIAANASFVIAVDALEFQAVYGLAPDMEAGTNTAAGSNGDDNMVLLDPLGQPVDVFGRVGEDGTGTDHDFEDGRALRLPYVQRGNPDFDASEWAVSNKRGGAGTVQATKNAPEDFWPGHRN